MSLYSCISEGGETGGGNNTCFRVVITTKNYAYELNWSVGPCTSNQTYTNNEVFMQGYCLDIGNYKITCKDSYGDGCQGAYLFINGQQYCEDFTSGHEQHENLTLTSTTG